MVRAFGLLFHAYSPEKEKRKDESLYELNWNLRQNGGENAPSVPQQKTSTSTS
jgi:hypothetical protein